MYEQHRIPSTLASPTDLARVKALLAAAGSASSTAIGRPVPPPVDVPERVDHVRGLQLVAVADDDQRRVWNELMRREHPHGAVQHVGAQMRYGYRPLLVETFVEKGRHAGTSLQAANWLEVGETALRCRRRAAGGGMAPRRRPAGDCPARLPARLRAQVVRADRPARRAADWQPALLRGPPGGGARRVLPGSLLAACRVQPRALRAVLACPAGCGAAGGARPNLEQAGSPAVGPAAPCTPPSHKGETR